MHRPIRLHEVQGPEHQSPIAGEWRVIEADLVGDFRGERRLRGIFVQEDDAHVDDDPHTSEGLFVFLDRDPTENLVPPLALGQRLRMLGQVAEFPDDSDLSQTQLRRVRWLERCRSSLPGTGLPSAAQISLPLAPLGPTSTGATILRLEAVEGMRVRLTHPLFVTNHHELGRFGDVTLSSTSADSDPDDSRRQVLITATEFLAPGSEEAAAHARNNAASQIVLGDGSQVRDPERVPYLGPDGRTLRRGDRIQALEGVVSTSFGSYRIEPTGPVAFERDRPRPDEPPEVGGDLTVASFNVLNYFTTVDDGSDATSFARGADSERELARQQAKITAALCAIDADVVALIELENNGNREASAIATLADAVSRRCPEQGSWTHIDTSITGPSQPGQNARAIEPITVGLIYKPESVDPVGPPVTLRARAVWRPQPDTGSSSLPRSRSAFGPEHQRPIRRRRQPLQVEGLPRCRGARCRPGRRSRLASMPLASSRRGTCSSGSPTIPPRPEGEPGVLLLGDFNAYTMEEPIRELVRGGFEHLLADQPPRERYTFAFRGEAGALDHALANPSLASAVTGAAVWHINADEPRALDYEGRDRRPELDR